ncbi:hypothetical protein [Marivirga arenosa]|uniref:Uncharacterized protein n=1 Tax=Marivirga arenosa TaxID=3059076 RepID=A0AA49J9T7_9BACT|nr:hypothetical protein [Marivirga sp. BKB1-2]WKK82944.2 hypothetical protein QYS47_13630 [Marivirga sp. BKB1-2]
MIISKVISYKNAWQDLINEHPNELEEVLEVLPQFISSYVSMRQANERTFIGHRDIWNELLKEKEWIISDTSFYLEDGQRIFIGNLGPIKNDVSAYISFGHIDFANRWLFQQTTLAGKYDIAKIPILLVPTAEFGARHEDRFFKRLSFEQYQKQILPLTPLSHSYPFLILGYTDQGQLFETEIHELESDPLISNENVVIDRCIEFPPEYYQAGLNILNYFGTYIREQYPDQEAKIKIEQKDKIVRLIIETGDGETEVIERALQEYQLVITGQKTPEEVTKNEKLILELKNELRLARYRVETQQDIMLVQTGQIDKLMNILSEGLANKSPIHIDFKPVITLDNKVVNNQTVTSVISDINDLKLLLGTSSPEYIELQNLEGSLTAIEKETDSEIVKNSTAMQKLRNFLNSVSEGNEQLAKVLETTETGIDIIRSLAGKYNSIAEWCGLPQVPRVFIK